MRNMEKEIIFFFIVTYLYSINAQKEPKSVKLEALTPRGLRVTIQGKLSTFKYIIYKKYYK